ncbi:MAG: hypothetical protein FJY26_03425 [Betaproteobacteria bacterium]|nr:hypothetical protein [Betaproteobacteria bacterium]
MLMKTLAPAAALLIASFVGPSQAQTNATLGPWERVGVYEGRTLYIDPTTARTSGSRIQIFTITDLKEANATARGRQYFSKKALLELDCSQKTLTVLQDTWYNRRMGQGEPVFQTDGGPQGPYPVQTDSPGELFWKGACGRR